MKTISPNCGGTLVTAAFAAFLFVVGTCAAFQAVPRECFAVDVEGAQLLDEPGGREIGGVSRFVALSVLDRVEGYFQTQVVAWVETRSLHMAAPESNTGAPEATIVNGGTSLLRVAPGRGVQGDGGAANRMGDILEGTRVAVIGTGTEASYIKFSCWVHMDAVATDEVSAEYVLSKFHFTEMHFEPRGEEAVCRGKVTCIDGAQPVHKMTLSVYSQQGERIAEQVFHVGFPTPNVVRELEIPVSAPADSIERYDIHTGPGIVAIYR